MPGFSTVSRADLADETAEDPDSEDMVGDGVLEYGWWELVGDAASEYVLWSWGADLHVDLSTCAYVTLAGLLDVGSYWSCARGSFPLGSRSRWFWSTPWESCGLRPCSPNQGQSLGATLLFHALPLFRFMLLPSTLLVSDYISGVGNVSVSLGVAWALLPLGLNR